MIDEPLEQEVRALGAVHLQDGVDRLEPLLRLERIDVLDSRGLGHAWVSPQLKQLAPGRDSDIIWV